MESKVRIELISKGDQHFEIVGDYPGCLALMVGAMRKHSIVRSFLKDAIEADEFLTKKEAERANQAKNN